MLDIKPFYHIDLKGEIANRANIKVQQSLDFKYNALITPIKHKQLFSDIIQQFNLDNMDIELRGFNNFNNAVAWGKSLGFNFDEVPENYMKELEFKYH